MTETVGNRQLAAGKERRKILRLYTVADLFYTEWKELSPKVQAQVYAASSALRAPSPEGEGRRASVDYGVTLIHILRLLRKNWRLVDKINEAQAVDCFNELKFLNEPWFFFPRIGSGNYFTTPEDHLARHTFDHFIYADNEFTHYIATQDEKYLKRLAVTLYSLPGEIHFDKESVDERIQLIETQHLASLQLIFFTFGHVREYVMKRCKTLLPAAPVVEAQDVAPVQPTGGMWLQLKHRLAETPAFQGYDNAGRANMYSALDYLEDLAKQNKRKET